MGKEFDPILDKPEKPEIHALKPIKKTLVKKAELHPYPGQKIWELELATSTIREADFKEEKIVMLPDFNLHTFKKQGTAQKVVRDINMREGCLYVNAINAKNADKKFHKILNKPYKK